MLVSDINVRAKRILHAVVSEYLATGEPVGSETVTRRYAVEVSPATVRNVMSDLEELGLLRHTHTSAGRIPTDRGLRYYVDTLLRVRSLSQTEKDDIRGQVNTAVDVQQVMQRTSRVLRELSHLAVVVQTPRPESDAISHIEFVRLRDNNLLAVIASASGQIQNKLVTTEVPLSNQELERIHEYLNGFITGLTLSEARARISAQVEEERLAQQNAPQDNRFLAKALALASAVVPAQGTATLLVDGQSNLLSATEDVDRAKRVLRTLEERDLIVRLLDRTVAAPGICVFIGAEANLPDLTDISVVTATYGSEGRPLGTIGVIGPSRMNYSKMIPLVDFTAEVITEALPKL
jgi:heat-inducible transcriptional repressor